MRAPASIIAQRSRSPEHAATNRRAAENIRRHALRAARRVAALLMVDSVCFIAARAMTRLGTTDSITDAATAGYAGLGFDIGNSDLGLAVALLVGTTIAGTYGPGDARRHIGRLFLAAALATALPFWTQLWNQPPAEALRTGLLAFAPLFIALVTLRTTFDSVSRRWSHRAGSTARARVVFVGTGSDCVTRQKGTVLNRRAGFDVLGFVDVAARPDNRALGSLEDLETVLTERDADTVVLCGLPTAAITSRVLRAAAVTECTVLAAAPQLELPAVRPNVIKQYGKPLLELRPVVLRVEQLVLKRTLDLVGATVLLILLAPVLAIIAAVVALDSGRPVLFAQRRLGRFGRSIRCLKFRTMCVDAEARLLADPVLYRQYVENDYKLPCATDNRITRVGRFLRDTSLDELPQLWNVLKGDMSLVGPRPIVPDEIHHYNGEGPLLLSIKPGITGAWQVSGRSAVSYPKRAALELEYVEGWSLWRDVAILLRTLPAVWARRGAL